MCITCSFRTSSHPTLVPPARPEPTPLSPLGCLGCLGGVAEGQQHLADHVHQRLAANQVALHQPRRLVGGGVQQDAARPRPPPLHLRDGSRAEHTGQPAGEQGACSRQQKNDLGEVKANAAGKANTAGKAPCNPTGPLCWGTCPRTSIDWPSIVSSSRPSDKSLEGIALSFTMWYCTQANKCGREGRQAHRSIATRAAGDVGSTRVCTGMQTAAF